MGTYPLEPASKIMKNDTFWGYVGPLGTKLRRFLVFFSVLGGLGGFSKKKISYSCLEHTHSFVKCEAPFDSEYFFSPKSSWLEVNFSDYKGDLCM